MLLFEIAQVPSYLIFPTAPVRWASLMYNCDSRVSEMLDDLPKGLQLVSYGPGIPTCLSASQAQTVTFYPATPAFLVQSSSLIVQMETTYLLLSVQQAARLFSCWGLGEHMLLLFVPHFLKMESASIDLLRDD